MEKILFGASKERPKTKHDFVCLEDITRCSICFEKYERNNTDLLDDRLSESGKASVRSKSYSEAA